MTGYYLNNIRFVSGICQFRVFIEFLLMGANCLEMVTTVQCGGERSYHFGLNADVRSNVYTETRL